MKRRVVLRGGPLDGHMRQVDEGTRTAYFPFPHASASELERLGMRPPGRGNVLVLVYKEVSPSMPVWKYIGVNAPTLGEGEA